MDKIKVILFPFAAIVLIIGAFIIALQFVLGRISPLTGDLSTSSAQQAALSQKVATLAQVNEEHLNQSEAAYLALPDKNPAAVVISQLKGQALNHNLVINSINVASVSVTEGDLSYAILELKTEGAQADIFLFLKELEKLAPLVSIQDTKVTNVIGGTTELQLALRTFWAPFPEKLPALTEAVSGLTDEEVNVLTQLSQLEPPAFTQLTPSAVIDGRADPFTGE